MSLPPNPRHSRLQSGSNQQPTRRTYAPFNDSQLEQIDAWGFEHRIRDRSAAIQELVLLGLRHGSSVGAQDASTVA
jgi:hypothetical protein